MCGECYIVEISDKLIIGLWKFNDRKFLVVTGSDKIASATYVTFEGNDRLVNLSYRTYLYMVLVPVIIVVAGNRRIYYVAVD